jgi:hypothetical protein
MGAGHDSTGREFYDACGSNYASRNACRYARAGCNTNTGSGTRASSRAGSCRAGNAADVVRRAYRFQRFDRYLLQL